MELAKQQFGIPLVLSAENLSSRDLDELSCMTYLSYFMKIDSPGHLETLRWVRQQVPAYNVRNFQVIMLSSTMCMNRNSLCTSHSAPPAGQNPRSISRPPHVILFDARSKNTRYLPASQCITPPAARQTCS